MQNSVFPINPDALVATETATGFTHFMTESFQAVSRGVGIAAFKEHGSSVGSPRSAARCGAAIVSDSGGIAGGLMRRATQKKSAESDQNQKGRTRVMSSTTEILKVVTDVSASDVAVPAGFKENK